MNSFQWANAGTVEDAVKLLKPPDAKVDPDEKPQAIGGGQDLLTSLKAYILRPPRVVNLKTIQGLDRIEVDDKGALKLGATATIAQLEEHPQVREKFPGLVEAAQSIATPQIRNLGTIGGNLCQRPRCWYFRLENYQCRKKGGTECFAKGGENKYNAIFGGGKSNYVHPSDLAPMLVALEATVSIAGPDGARTIPLADFFILPSIDVRRENVLKDGEIVTQVQVPASPLAGRSTYLKFKERDSMDFAIAAVAAAVDLGADKTVRRARLVLGGVGTIPWHVPAAEEFLAGKQLSEAVVTQAAQIALQGAKPMEQNQYKIPLTQALVRRALTKLSA
ncbi:MAG TPA: xanthine dehydrogenase family protein subunit M [Tepidisphaeraceae bacterium]|jgi:xanthine dehydrogenase YagS FAD-binding subunit|nr:xanthine dehydrogenase family protein subunit M [Tepidisphaeraceae bacterium]